MPDHPQAVLIVDDTPDTAKVLAGYFRTNEPQWNIETALNDADALEKVKQRLAVGKPFSVLITDLLMNNDSESGMRLIQSVQSIDPLAMTILCTGFPDLVNSGGRPVGWWATANSELKIFDVIVKAGLEATAMTLLTRTRVAMRYRSWAVRMSYMTRYFNPNFFEATEKDPSLLVPSNREVTIVFWDIRGFSKLCEQLKDSPELIAGFLKEYSERAAKVVYDFNGLLDKFMGDGIMALFGLLDQSENGQIVGATAAVSTAVSLQSQFRGILQTWSNKWQRRTYERINPLVLACGVNSGRALVGNLGTDFRDQFTALGAHVNFAQRLESIAGREPGVEILVSNPTKLLIEQTIPVVFFKNVSDIKNIPGEHPVFCVNVAALPASSAR